MTKLFTNKEFGGIRIIQYEITNFVNKFVGEVAKS